MSKLELEMKIPTCHRIDFDKVKTVKDIKAILQATEIIIYDNNDHWDKVKHLLIDRDDK